MQRGVSNEHVLVNQSVNTPDYRCKWRCYELNMRKWSNSQKFN